MVIVRLANYTPSAHHLLNLSEAQPAPIFAFLTAQTPEPKARRHP